jgi:hypothetical protein
MSFHSAQKTDTRWQTVVGNNRRPPLGFIIFSWPCGSLTNGRKRKNVVDFAVY